MTSTPVRKDQFEITPKGITHNRRLDGYPRRNESSESFSRLEAGQFIKLAQTFNTFLKSYSSKLDLNKDVKFAMGETYLYVIRGGLLKAARRALQDVQK